MTVIVFGGTGFIGRNVCAALAARGRDVLAVSRTRPAVPVPGAAFAPLDLVRAARDELAGLIRSAGAEAVVNAAGASWQARTEELMTEAHVSLVANLQAALACLGKPPHFVQIGTVHEYGEGRRGSAIDENTPAAATTLYGRSKLAGTKLLLDAAGDGRLDCLVMRVSNVVGAGAPATSLPGRVADLLREAAVTGGPAVLEFGSLDAYRDFVDARDVADAVATAVTTRTCGLLNIGSGRAVRARDLVECLVRLSGVPARIEVAEAAGTGPAGWQLMDVTRARRLLGWAPRRSLEEALQALWAGRRAA
ncbi:NAD(P)-dependent oxidoreductase [Amycolatopsis sp. NPDC049688]|uniref:NAD-dependent epimerase/dehydratase family protein n=1 Tax=Amycolatopsis sp. NPDC049688 TaxID=3154733 RepID=UPI00341A119F